MKLVFESIEFREDNITQTVLDALETLEHEFDVKTTETAKMDPCLLVTCQNADWTCSEGICSRKNFKIECNADGAKLEMRFGHLFDNIDALQMPFDFSSSVIFNDAVIEAEPSNSDDFDVELNIPIFAFEMEHTNGVISYGGRVKGEEGLVTDDSGLLILGGPISAGFRCVFPDSVALSTSTTFMEKPDEENGESPWTLGNVDNVDAGDDETIAASPAEFELESSVDPDNPPKIGDRITISVKPSTGFSENNPIVYFISKITVSDPLDDTTSLDIYKNPCAFSFLNMEFSFGNEATGLGQSQTFSLDSFIFPGSGGMQFDIEMKMCVVDGNGETVDPECVFDDICTLPYSTIAA
ncbi:unnamed protein product [Oikopleura dioica]|uniref:ZP domain-containing protein n=1 Tax=Oikopleura dioica TaxID=34765 RepID=E4X3A7_OIKDI|nr:unnamed protein product [Oikopleura dioica]